jgi:hypothetical protein
MDDRVLYSIVRRHLIKVSKMDVVVITYFVGVSYHNCNN